MWRLAVAHMQSYTKSTGSLLEWSARNPDEGEQLVKGWWKMTTRSRRKTQHGTHPWVTLKIIVLAARIGHPYALESIDGTPLRMSCYSLQPEFSWKGSYQICITPINMVS